MKRLYCDESCHLENDGNDIMVLGAIMCDEIVKNQVFKEIKLIKEKHGVSPYFEIKWTKVSNGKIELYKELIEYFFNNSNLNFRGLVAKGKKNLDHEKYNSGSFDKWYYKMYYLLLNHMIYSDKEYRIFLDIKDTKGGPRVKKLHDVLCNNRYDFKKDVIKKVEQIHSNHSEILQLTDLIIGALSYYNRGLITSKAKLELIKLIENRVNHKLNVSSNRNQTKFNLFIWEGKSEK